MDLYLKMSRKIHIIKSKLNALLFTNFKAYGLN